MSMDNLRRLVLDRAARQAPGFLMQSLNAAKAANLAAKDLESKLAQLDPRITVTRLPGEFSFSSDALSAEEIQREVARVGLR